MNGYERGRIHPTAIVSDRATVGSGVTIGAYAIVYDNVHVGDRATIGPRVTLGEPTLEYYRGTGYENPLLRLGPDAVVRSGSVIYAGAEIGAALETGHDVVIRERTRIGEHTRISTGVEIMGDCLIGDYDHLYKGVIVGRRTRIGNYVWLHPNVMIADDPYPPSTELSGCTIDDYAVVGACSVLLPGVTIGRHAVVAARTRVWADIPPGGLASEGVPTRIGEASKLRSRQSGKPVYPWPSRFSRDMPWRDVGYGTWSGLVEGPDRNDRPNSQEPASNGHTR